MNNEAKILQDIASLQQHPGWNHILEMIDHEITANTEEVLNINPNNDKQAYSKNDMLRSELMYLKFFKNAPQTVKDKYNSVIDTGSPI